MKPTSTKNTGIERLKFLICGESGAGKTTLASTIKEPALIISAEAGLLVLKDHDIDVIDISVNDKGELLPEEQRVAKFQEVYSYLLTEEARNKYKWIFLDSVTELNENLLAFLQTKYPNKSDSMKLFGENAKIMKKIIRDIRDIPFYSVVFTCLIKVSQNEDGVVIKQPMVTGSLKDSITSFFDECFYLFTQPSAEKGAPNRRGLLTGCQGSIGFAKDRSGSLDLIEPADLQHVADKIRGKQ